MHNTFADASVRKNNKSFFAKKGNKIHKPNGHRSILDNGWIPTKRLKKGTYGLIKKHRGGGSAIPTVEEYIA
jgi:hypothetical protein